MKSSTGSAYAPRKPCCKVCKDSGESESVYTSHYVKDRDGHVCCPKLLKIQCIRCGKHGHTGGYCTTPEASIKPIQQKPVVPAKAAENRNSRFACLVDSSDSDDDEKLLARKHSKPVELRPSAPTTSYAKPPTNTRWNNAKPAPEPKIEPVSKINIANTVEFPSLVEHKTTSTTPSTQMSYVAMVAKPVPSKPERRDIVIPEVKAPIKPRYHGIGLDFDWVHPPKHEDDSSDDENSYYSGLAMDIEDF